MIKIATFGFFFLVWIEKHWDENWFFSSYIEPYFPVNLFQMWKIRSLMMWFCRGWYSKWSDAISHVLALKRHAFLYGMFLTVKDAAIKKKSNLCNCAECLS